MRPIPPKIRQQISDDPFYRKCCITGSRNVSIEHVWTYSGRQIDDLFALVPLRRDLNVAPMDIEIKERCKLISLNRATEEDLKKYPKKDWKTIHKYLKNKYETN